MDAAQSNPPRTVLLTVPNAHVATDFGKNHPPEFDATKDFVAYMPNCHGEQMVVVGKRDDDDLTLYHGDCGWTPLPIHADGRADLIGHDGEFAFLVACRIEYEGWKRMNRDKAGD